MKTWAVYLDSTRDRLIVLPHTAQNIDAFGEPIQEDFATMRRAERWADQAQATLDSLKRVRPFCETCEG